jgi:hypothetical protein
MQSLVREIMLNYMRTNTLVSRLEVVLVAFVVTFGPMAITWTMYDQSAYNYYELSAWGLLSLGLFYHFTHENMFLQMYHVYMRKANINLSSMSTMLDPELRKRED